jgi:uncharacterized protein
LPSAESNREKFGNGVILFNSAEFFKAHEVWEEIWLSAGEPEKTFLQGLIQLAAAFHHYSRGNRSGAQSLAITALEKLEKFPAHYYGMNLNALRVAAREWLAAPSDHPACVPVPTPRIEVANPSDRTEPH